MDTQLHESRLARFWAGISDRDHDIPDKPVAPDPLDRRAGKNFAESSVVELRQIGQQGRGQFGPGVKGRIPRGAGELVPGTNGQAVVAAIDAIADGAAEFMWDVALMLDGEIRNAAPCIEPVGCDDSLLRAEVNAARAGAAMAFMAVGTAFKGQVGEYFAQKKP